MCNKYICIHGHFYQPPRENPWTGTIDKQPSAAPFNDWNERIAEECYEPNSIAVIKNQRNKITKNSNNSSSVNILMCIKCISGARFGMSA